MADRPLWTFGCATRWSRPASESYGSVGAVYAYDEQGRPLVNARVFDESGNPVAAALWGCVTESGAIVAQVFPRCADPRPLGWSELYAVPRLEQVPPEPTASATPGSTASPTPDPASSPTPEPTATG